MGKVISISRTQVNDDEHASSLSRTCETAFSRKVALNRMCVSLVAPENQRRFTAFPEAYCREYSLSLEQIHAVTDLDIERLLKLGGTVSNLEILTGIYGLDIIELCCQQTGKSPKQVRILLG